MTFYVTYSIRAPYMDTVALHANGWESIETVIAATIGTDVEVIQISTASPAMLKALAAAV